ncbi:hypothetical protein AXF42_Ash009135 [Apostasia shenzhenica]|uniref:Uncharacterized protein n=1 Tax=Apostasia shenzhenica TaxID=1088818 RepID=A0A2I0ADL6_9ASPA|nr:hypothetical protein AXF42_Ash009135 [Apostasia shenzhenica]
MSRREREGRDSHGKRLHSRFDREPSPKKAKRDEKPEVERTHSSHHHSSVVDAAEQKQKQKHVQEDVPLEPSPVAMNVRGHENEKKHQQVEVDRPPMGPQHSSDHRELARPRSYYQHDDRGSAGHGGRSFVHRVTDHRRRGDSKERSRNWTRESETHDRQKKEENFQSHVVERKSVWQHDKFHELDSRAPTARKRPAFREKKISAEPEPAVPESAATRREERGGFHHKHERNIAQSRERFEGMRGTSDGNRFSGRFGDREIRSSRSFEVEKWKHDLFDEANKSPPSKNEEEQIAKIEALLSL